VREISLYLTDGGWVQDEAKKDLARLAEVKRRREEAEKRKAEEEAGTLFVFSSIQSWVLTWGGSGSVAAAEREKLRKKTEEKKDDGKRANGDMMKMEQERTLIRCSL
jgi:hypothetical protein